MSQTDKNQKVRPQSQMEKMLARDIDKLCAGEPRGSATLAERQAAEYMYSQANAMDLDARIEPFRSTTSLGLVLAFHFGLLCLMALVGGYYPLQAIFIVVLLLLSMWGVGTSRFPLVSKAIAGGDSCNVVVRIQPREKESKKLVLVAHMDSQRTGMIFEESLARKAQQLSQKMPVLLNNPLSLPNTAAVLLIPLLLLHLFGLSGTVMSLVMLIPALVLAATTALVIQWGVSPFVPGASDNASGVAALLWLMRYFKAHPLERTELIFLFSGSEEVGLLGSAAFLAAHGEKLDRESTTFLCIDTLGNKDPVVLREESSLFFTHHRYPADLLKICRDLAQSSLHKGVRQISLPVPTDATAFLERRYRGVTLISTDPDDFARNYHLPTDTPENVDIGTVVRCTSFARDLVRRMDQEQGR